MQNNFIYINQALHGYSNGHHLLASSVKLSEKSTQKMAILSDLSGPEIQPGFTEYYTGYFLPEDNKAVLSYTWYADEMERPGCVWTHSLIFDVDDFCVLKNRIYQLIHIFKRPNETTNIQEYSKIIKLNDVNSNYDLEIDISKLKYLIWAIWGNKSPSIILANSSNEFAIELIYLWIQQNKDLDSHFSFSTGSLALRRYGEEIIKLQFVPKNIINSVIRSYKELEVLHEIGDIKSFPLWVLKATDLQLKDGWNDFNKFRNMFGENYMNNVFFASFLKVYLGAKVEAKKISVVDALKVIDKIFLDDEKYAIVKKLFDLYFSNQLCEWETVDNSLSLLEYFVEIKKLMVNTEQLEILVNKGLVGNQDGAKTLIHNLAYYPVDETRKAILSSYAQAISLEFFSEFADSNLTVCKILVSLNLAFAQSVFLWKQSREFQEEIVYCLKENKEEVSKQNNLPYIILDNSLFDFIDEVYYIFASRSIDVFLDYLLEFRALASGKTSHLKDICKAHTNFCIRRLSTQINLLDSKKIVLLIELINPYSKDALSMSSEFWINIFNKINSTWLEREKMTIALFFLPIILQSYQIFPIQLVAFVFDVIHTSAKEQKLPDKEWYRMESILPKVGFFDQWDRCKRLRKVFKKKGYKLKDIEDYDDFDNEIHLL
jgi:hypothetical protein